MRRDAAPLKRYLPALLPAAMFCVAIAVMHRLGGEFRLHDVLAEFSAVGYWRALLAIGLTAGSYLLLAGYERLALRYIQLPLSWRRSTLIAFIASAVGQNVGVAALSGGAIRYRMYAPLGVAAADVARIVVFSTLTFGLAASTLAGLSLIVHAGEASSVLHATGKASIVAGTLLLAVVAAYLLACALQRGHFTWRDHRITLPTAGIAAGQIALGVADLTLACAALYVLLPPSSTMPFLAFAALYMVALTASVASFVPGGLGVFESSLALLMPQVPLTQLLGALLAYRLVYYALPFIVAVFALSAHEARRHREKLSEAWALTQRSLDFVVPQAMALLTFGAGFLLLLSGTTPGAAARLAALNRILPLSVLEVSHLAGSAVGVLLLILARGLMRRLDGAWQVTMALLAAGAVVSLLKGLAYEEALLLAGAMVPLWWTRDQFYRKSSLLAESLSPAWLASACIAIGAAIWVGLLAYRRVPYANELWWQFALDAQAPRMLRANLLAVLMLGTFAVYRLLAPARVAPKLASATDLERALPIIRASAETSANLALLGDKALLFSDSGKSFLMYGISHRSWVAMGDPIGLDAEKDELIWRFRELADRAGAWSVFYQVAAEDLSLYVDAGLALSKLGEEARVRLDSFSLEGSARSSLRQTHRRSLRDGLSFRIAPAADVPALLPQLRRISDEWLQNKAVEEKGFSLGRFSPGYLQNFSIALVEWNGAPVAFANLWESTALEELSVDLMRHSRAAPGAVMDFLFVELMLWGKARGYRWFNLGMAPLAGLEAHRLAPAWHKFGRLIYRYGEDFYNFEGLRQYKEKFLPEWRARYLAAPGGLARPRVLVDVTALISGGLMDTIRKERSGSGREPLVVNDK